MSAERREVPDRWRPHMIKARAVDQRGLDENRNPRPGVELRPSMSELARMAGTKPTTISHLMYGTRETEPAIVARVAKVLGLGLDEIHALMGIDGTDQRDPFKWPGEVDLLNGRDREAGIELILGTAERPRRTGLVDWAR